jgi:poly(3-hydroxybutyrate) depolymerase
MGRRVYPGFIQLASFMSMNLEKHQEAHWRYLQQLMDGDGDSAEKHREFYDEYLAALDLSEEFYLQTVDVVFQRYLLPKGELSHRGRLVRPALIDDIALLTVEGEHDDISGIGQTQAAHDICTGIPAEMKHDYIQPRVGHYGVFNGRRFREEIYPRVRQVVWQAELDLARNRGANPLPKSTRAA